MIVASVVPFGLFVRVPELHVDGLVHVTALPRDYYHRDPTGTELRGERSGNSYRLTDRLRVRLANVNVDERKIDFVPIEPERDGADADSAANVPQGTRKGGSRGASRAAPGGGARGDKRARSGGGAGSRSGRRKRGRG